MKAKAGNPRGARRFHFAGRHYDSATGEARLEYAFDDGPLLTERLVFPFAPWPQDPGRQASFLRALELLHLIAGVSYYKAGLPPHIDTGERAPDPSLAQFLGQLYQEGLGEFAHVNGLDLEGRIKFPAGGTLQPVTADIELPERALLAMGGGKDSLVSLELLRAAGIEIQPFTVGESGLIEETARAAGLPLITVRRDLAPELLEMNAAGAWNGHVPVTAINSAIGVCAALLYGFRWVVFSNERSADEATLTDARGRVINHQYSKSLEFERGFRRMVQRHVSPGAEYFSLLRPLGELAVAKKFAGLSRYHPAFSSCNRNFHRDGPRISGRWCRDCPKCRFTSLALAPFMTPQDITAIFGDNLLDRPEQEEGYRALLALGVDKPFECVGTVGESRAALTALGADDAWAGCLLVRKLAPELPPGNGLQDWLEPGVEHCIPREVASRVVF